MAIAKAHVLLNRPGALAPIPTPPASPLPTALPQDQSPLYSIIPPEIRTRIFEFAVALPTYNGKAWVEGGRRVRHAGEFAHITIPAITGLSRVVRREALPLFLQLNNFTFAPLTDNTGEEVSKSVVGKWLTAMSSHLPSMHQLTFEVKRLDRVRSFTSKDILSATIRHDQQHNRWNATIDDDWGDIDEAELQWLEQDNALLKQIIVPMLDQRSRDDLTPAYLMWLMLDLRMFYAGEKLKPSHPPDAHWILGTRGSWPDLMRPPEMYTRHLEHEYWLNRPRWACSRGHRLDLEADGVFRCECEKA